MLLAQSRVHLFVRCMLHCLVRLGGRDDKAVSDAHEAPQARQNQGARELARRRRLQRDLKGERRAHDERIDDGLTGRNGIRAMARVLADPERWLGCIADDGSDTKPLWPQENWASDGFRVWD